MAATADPWAEYKAEVEAHLDFAKIYADIQGAKPSGNGHLLGLCPFHEDHDPSFGFDTKTGQWECFAGCGKGSAFDYLMRRSNRAFKEVLLDMGDQLGVPRPGRRSSGQIAYAYRDEAGTLLFEVLRGADKKFWQRRPDGNGGWIKSLNGVRRVLYRLPDLLARPGETVFVVEGEKDADALLHAGLLATTNSGGAGKWRDEYNTLLRDRDVVILPDNDAPGRQHSLQVARALQGIAKTIKIIALPGLPEKGDVSDWLAAGHMVPELLDLVAKSDGWRSDREAIGGSARPAILISDRQQTDILQDAWRALLAQNDPPRLFTCAGKLARLVPTDSHPALESLSHAAAYGVLIRAADWVQQRGDRLVAAKPPLEAAGDILANPHPNLPPLEAVLTTPVFDREWRLLSTPGYHREARVWLHLSEDGATYDVPIRPTVQELAAARSLLLDDLLADFPFTADSDRAHAVAAILLPFARRMFEGPTPIHLIEAPTPGSGKSLLADLITIIALGESAGGTTITRDENETRKKITALLARGRAVIAIDNVEGGLSSSQVASAITTEMWDDRVLGQTQMITPPNKALWLVSANNPNLSLEIARRCVRIRLNPAEEQPWKRTGFKHPSIQQWAKKNRPALVRAVLTIIRSWIAAGVPQGKSILGSFEAWSGMIGGMVAHLDLPGFLGDADEFYAAADSESGEWGALVDAWWNRHHGNPVRATDLLELADTHDLVAFARTGTSETARKTKFGRALNGLRNRKFGEVEVVVSQDGHAKARLYRLRSLAKELFPVGEESQ